MSGDPPFRDVAGRPKGPLTAEDWDGRWRDESTPWEMGHATPPLVSAVAEGLAGPPGRALVPGCGTGHEVRMLAAAGFDAVGLDIAPLAIERARRVAREEGSTARFVVGNLLALPAELTGMDVVVEHCCFCALDPSLRDAYVDAVADALRPGGRLLGLFFVFEAEEGPPFGASEEELRHRFGRRFRIEFTRRPTDSHPRRADRDLLLLANLA